ASPATRLRSTASNGYALLLGESPASPREVDYGAAHKLTGEFDFATRPRGDFSAPVAEGPATWPARGPALSPHRTGRQGECSVSLGPADSNRLRRLGLRGLS